MMKMFRFDVVIIDEPDCWVAMNKGVKVILVSGTTSTLYKSISFIFVYLYIMIYLGR